MYVSITEAKGRFSQFIRAVERGERVIITRYEKPVAELSLPAAKPLKVTLDGMKDTIKLHPGWDDPIDEDRFLAGDF